MEHLDLLTQSFYHYLFSGLAACGAYLLTWITSCVVYRIYHGRAPLTQAVSIFTIILACVLAFASAWYVHTLLDMFSVWWVTPLGPPLEIILKSKGS